MAFRTRTLKKGDKFTAKTVDEDGEFTFFSAIKEFPDSEEEYIIAFKGGIAWVMEEADVDDDSIPVVVVAPKATAAFPRRGKNNG